MIVDTKELIRRCDDCEALLKQHRDAAPEAPPLPFEVKGPLPPLSELLESDDPDLKAWAAKREAFRAESEAWAERYRELEADQGREAKALRRVERINSIRTLGLRRLVAKRCPDTPCLQACAEACGLGAVQSVSELGDEDLVKVLAVLIDPERDDLDQLVEEVSIDPDDFDDSDAFIREQGGEFRRLKAVARSDRELFAWCAWVQRGERTVEELLKARVSENRQLLAAALAEHDPASYQAIVGLGEDEATTTHIASLVYNGASIAEARAKALDTPPL